MACLCTVGAGVLEGNALIVEAVAILTVRSNISGNEAVFEGSGGAVFKTSYEAAEGIGGEANARPYLILFVAGAGIIGNGDLAIGLAVKEEGSVCILYVAVFGLGIAGSFKGLLRTDLYVGIVLFVVLISAGFVFYVGISDSILGAFIVGGREYVIFFTALNVGAGCRLVIGVFKLAQAEAISARGMNITVGINVGRACIPAPNGAGIVDVGYADGYLCRACGIADESARKASRTDEGIFNSEVLYGNGASNVRNKARKGGGVSKLVVEAVNGISVSVNMALELLSVSEISDLAKATLIL